MKSHPILLASILFFMTSCGSGDSAQFEGVWQSIDDPSKQVIFTRSGKTYTFATRNIPSAVQGMPGTYNKDLHALEFDNGDGDTTIFIFNSTSHHLLGLNEEFAKASETIPEENLSTNMDENQDQEEGESISDTSTSDTEQPTGEKGICAKGQTLVISGNNVRLRNEPDVTKQNILMQVHKNFEVTQLDDKTVDGQKWYKVCYDGNIGWVSGQYAAAK